MEFGASTSQFFEDKKSLNPAFPSIGDYVNTNLSSFSPDNSNVYVGQDIVSEVSGTFFRVKVKIVAVYVVNDHDGFGLGAGEIFVEGTANGNYTRNPSVGNELALNDGENGTLNIFVLDTLAQQVNVTFEVRDRDTADADDSLGFATLFLTTPTNGTFDLVTDIGDAHLYLTIEALLSQNALSATQLLEGYRPYLFVDDETDKTEMPTLVVGRVISGTDSGSTALLLQYYFYWDTENSPDGGTYSFELHKNDYEALYIYIRPTSITSPYRIVFNDWQYTDVTDFPAQQLLILDGSATTTTENAYLTNISSELQPLLGVATNQTAKTMSLSSIADWEYDSLLNLRTNAWRTSLLGYQTIDLTIDTSYHTFDLGPGGTPYGYNYSVQELNSSLLTSWYGEITQTFANGTHVWSYFGIDIPVVAPFTIDVLQVFNAPYIISGYHNVVEKAGALTLAKNSGLNITQSMGFNIGFRFVGDIVIEQQQAVVPGENTILNVSLDMDPNDFFVNLGFNYTINASLAYWFAQSEFFFNTSFNFPIQIPLGTIGAFLDALGFGSYEKNDVSIIDKYFDLTYLMIKPSFIGTLVNASLELQIWDLVRDLLLVYYPPSEPVLRAINFFIDTITLSINPIIEGVVRASVTSSTPGVSLNASKLTFTQDTKFNIIEVSLDSSFSAPSLTLNFENITYDLDFSTDWSLSVNFRFPLKILISGVTWDIGTFPTYSASIFESPSGAVTLPVGSPSSSIVDDISSSASPTPTPISNTEPSSIGIFAITVALIAVPIIRNRKRP